MARKFIPTPEANWWGKLHFEKGGGKTTMQTELLTEAAKELGCRVNEKWRVNKVLSAMAASGLVVEVEDAISGMRRYQITDAGRSALAQT